MVKPVLGFVLVLSLAGAVHAASDQPGGEARASEPQRELLRQVRTVLLSSKVTSWLRRGEPLYNITVAFKTKLGRAGFQVVLDPQQPHDAVLDIDYRESPGREYQPLQQGTKVSCQVALRHPILGVVLAYHFEAETSWPVPAGSPYWDAISRLEENPYYYYFGELVQGWLTAQADAVAVFSAVLRQPPVKISSQGTEEMITAQMAANLTARLYAIQELGLRRDRRALDTLWKLVAQPTAHERRAAIAAIGEIGDPASVEPLARLLESEPEPSIRAAAAAAIERIRNGGG